MICKKKRNKNALTSRHRKCISSSSRAGFRCSFCCSSSRNPPKKKKQKKITKSVQRFLSTTISIVELFTWALRTGNNNNNSKTINKCVSNGQASSAFLFPLPRLVCCLAMRYKSVSFCSPRTARLMLRQSQRVSTRYKCICNCPNGHHHHHHRLHHHPPLTSSLQVPATVTASPAFHVIYLTVPTLTL